LAHTLAISVTTENNSYDQVPYLSEPFPLSRPGYLSVLSQIFGNNSTAPDRASVLELGCGSGNNILPQAYLYPESNYVGVDSSQSQIALGQELILELGLKNIKLIHSANVINLKHENIELDALGRKVIALADATKTIEQIEEIALTDTQTTFRNLSEDCLLIDNKA